MKRYPDIKAGQWVAPKKSGYRMECCDCGLVHVLEFRLYRGQVQMRGYRDNRATARRRKKRGLA